MRVKNYDNNQNMTLLLNYKHTHRTTVLVAFFTVIILLFAIFTQGVRAAEDAGGTSGSFVGTGVTYKPGAAGGLGFSVGIPGFNYQPGIGSKVINANVSNLLNALFKLAFSFAAIIITIVIAFSGIKLLAVAAGGNVKGRTEALAMLKNSLLSLVIIIGSYIILHTINPDLVRLEHLTIPT